MSEPRNKSIFVRADITFSFQVDITEELFNRSGSLETLKEGLLREITEGLVEEIIPMSGEDGSAFYSNVDHKVFLYVGEEPYA